MQQLAESGAVDITTTSTLGGWIGRYAAATAVTGTFAVSALGVATADAALIRRATAVCGSNGCVHVYTARARKTRTHP